MSYERLSPAPWENSARRHLSPPLNQLPAAPHMQSFSRATTPGIMQPQTSNPLIILQQMELELHNTQQERDKAYREHSERKIALKALQAAYDGLLEAIKSAPQFSGTAAVTKVDVPRYKAGDPIPPFLENVKYWKRSEYLEAKRKGKNATGVKGKKENRDADANTMTWYVTDENGVTAGAAEIEFMRERARAGWWLLLRLGLAPTTWCKITVEASDIWEFYMVSRFVKLTFGEENWKAHMIATDNYPSWVLTRKREGHAFSGPPIPQSVKLEPIDMTVDAPSSTSTTQPPIASKRRLSAALDVETNDQKRPRTTDSEASLQNEIGAGLPITPSTTLATDIAMPTLGTVGVAAAPVGITVEVTNPADNGATLEVDTAEPTATGPAETTKALDKLHMDLADVFSQDDDLGVAAPTLLTSESSTQGPAVMEASGGDVEMGAIEGDGDGRGVNDRNTDQPPPNQSPPPERPRSVGPRVIDAAPEPALQDLDGGKLKSRKARRSKGATRKGICKNAWIDMNPKGTERQWEAYWAAEGKDWEAPSA